MGLGCPRSEELPSSWQLFFLWMGKYLQPHQFAVFLEDVFLQHIIGKVFCRRVWECHKAWKQEMSGWTFPNSDPHTRQYINDNECCLSFSYCKNTHFFEIRQKIHEKIWRNQKQFVTLRRRIAFLQFLRRKNNRAVLLASVRKRPRRG